MRVTNAVQRKKRKHNILSIVKGHRNRANNCVDIATGRSKRTLQAITYGRKNKRRDSRSLLIQRVNALCRQYGLVYSRSINPLKLYLEKKYNHRYHINDIVFMNEHSDIIKNALSDLSQNIVV